MTKPTGIRRLGPDDLVSLIALRREALENHPFAFSASVEDDRGLVPEFVRAALAADVEQATFGHFDDGKLSGMVGVARGSSVKRRHRASVYGMYVAPHARERGAGRALLAAAIEQARAWPGVRQVGLSVTDVAEAARRLYEASGFRCWGREPRALQWGGRFVAELHLVLDLDE